MTLLLLMLACVGEKDPSGQDSGTLGDGGSDGGGTTGDGGGTTPGDGGGTTPGDGGGTTPGDGGGTTSGDGGGGELNSWDRLEGPVLGIPNLDDDDDDGQADWDRARISSAEDDLSPLELPALAAGEVLDLSISGDVGDLRVWREGTLLLDSSTLSARIEGPLDGLDLMVEFATFRVEGALSLSIEGLGTWELDLRSSPLILNHHLQDGELQNAMSYPGTYGNAAMLAGYTEILGSAFESYPAASYDYDVWLQDEIEYGTATAPGLRLDVVLDSIRSSRGQYLDGLVRTMGGPGVAVLTYGSGAASSQDYFGNLEISPPVTVDGVRYPYGRIYWGHSGSDRPHRDLRAALEDQAVQEPFELDVGWLCVGHVDEFMTFLPDSASDKGFVLVVADTELGWEFLSSLDPSTQLSKYRTTHGYRTVGDMQNDSAMQRENEDMQLENIEPALEIMLEELDLDEGDVLRIPALFEQSRLCGAALALIPGTANMTVYPMGGEIHAFMPDPFLREDGLDAADDPFAAEIESLLPAGVVPHWLDDWHTYHANWGEVHCGSNTMRTPTASWWDEADHLLGVD